MLRALTGMVLFLFCVPLTLVAQISVVIPASAEFVEPIDAPPPPQEGMVEVISPMPSAPPAGTVEVAAPVSEVLEESMKEEPKYPTVQVTGFFHLDAARFSQSALNRFTVGDIDDGLSFRRTRPAITGNVTENISYVLELDFAQTQPRFVDTWVDFDKVPLLGHVRIGRWRQPFGMSSLTSIRELPFLERPVPFALSPFRATGIGFYNHAENGRATWAFSTYRYFTDFFGNVVGDNGGYGVAGRVTYLPLDFGGNHVVHVGGDYTYNDPARDQLIFLSPPEVFVTQSLGLLDQTPVVGTPFVVNTGLIPAHYYHGVNLEAAAGWGPFIIQGEARWAMVKGIGVPATTLPACYLHARYVLTGEHVPYDRKQGVFRTVSPNNPVSPCGGWGAWEVAARISHVDLDGTTGDGPGRKFTALTLGLNWYLNDYVKFQFNYISGCVDDPQFGCSSLDIFAMRTQLSF